jgi:hypothetical protein
MATFLDVSILSGFTPIFVWILIFAIVYGLLEFVKPFGKDNKQLIHGTIAVIIAFIFVTSGVSVRFITLSTPWFVVLGLVLFFILFFSKMFGDIDADIKKSITSGPVLAWILIFVGIIVFVGLSDSFGQELLEQGEGIQTAPSGYQPGQVVQGPNGSTVVVPSQNYVANSPASLNPATPGTTSTTTDKFSTNLLNIIRHPKVLGVVFVLLVAAFALLFLSNPVSKPQ